MKEYVQSEVVKCFSIFANEYEWVLLDSKGHVICRKDISLFIVLIV
jgi:hypothetical protein